MSDRPNENEADKLSAYAELALAYATVFGVDDAHRTSAQKKVWADLQVRSYVNRPMMMQTATGACDPLRVAFAEGARCHQLAINKFLSDHSDGVETNENKRTKVKK